VAQHWIVTRSTTTLAHSEDLPSGARNARLQHEAAARGLREGGHDTVVREQTAENALFIVPILGPPKTLCPPRHSPEWRPGDIYYLPQRTYRMIIGRPRCERGASCALSVFSQVLFGAAREWLPSSATDRVQQYLCKFTKLTRAVDFLPLALVAACGMRQAVGAMRRDTEH